MDEINQNFSDTIHSDLLATKDLVYNPCKFDCNQPLVEAQNAEYGAYIFDLNGLYVRFRVARITPTKVGQLYEQGILSNKGKGGKRAIRVYPPWDKTTSRQAQKTQMWQLKYFLEVPYDIPIDCIRAQMLYALNHKKIPKGEDDATYLREADSLPLIPAGAAVCTLGPNALSADDGQLDGLRRGTLAFTDVRPHAGPLAET